MTIYIVQGRYTGRALKGLLEQPEDRSQMARALMEAAGCKVVAFYVTFGEYDFMHIVESDSEEAVVAGLLPAIAGGAISGLKTSVAMTGEQARRAMMQAQQVAARFRPPGN